jgi:hypothetical protein
MLVTVRSKEKIDRPILGIVIVAAFGFVLEVGLGVGLAVRCTLLAKPTVKLADDPLKVAPKILFYKYSSVLCKNLHDPNLKITYV